MSAITGQSFLTLLDQMLNRANLSGLAMAHYSFFPIPNQEEFLYNNLLSVNSSFLQTVSGVQINNIGSGFGLTEVPDVSFQSSDAGSGAVGTAVMKTISGYSGLFRTNLDRAFIFAPSGNNLINNWDFSSGCTGWAYAQNVSLGFYEFKENMLYVSGGITLIPNGDSLYVTGSSYCYGSLDIVSGLTGTSSGVLNFNALRDSSGYQKMNPIQLNNKSGTIYFGTWVNASGIFYPTIQLTNSGESGTLIVDNVKLYVNYNREVARDSAFWDVSHSLLERIYFGNERFNMTFDVAGNGFDIGNGINEYAFVQKYGPNTKPENDLTYPTLRVDMLKNWENYTISFWHLYTAQSTAQRVILAHWPNFQLEVRNGYYGLLCVPTNTYIASTAQATGGWHNFKISISPYLFVVNM